MKESLAVLEVSALGAALVVLDQVDKTTPIRVLQAELNDYYGYVVKLQGDRAALGVAVATAQEAAQQMGAKCVTSLLGAPDARAWPVIESPPDYQPLIEQDVVFFPRTNVTPSADLAEGNSTMASAQPFAIGLIETQGFTAVIEAIDTACKAADVEVLGKEKLGGGYVTVLIKGDVAAVKAAIEAGRARVPELGNLIAAHVIARPSQAILGLLPGS